MYVNARPIIEQKTADGMKVLVQVRNKPYEGGKWLELPGGRVEEFESLVTTLRREVREETGLEVIFIIYLNKSCLLIELWMVGMLAQAPRPFLLFSCSRNPSREFWDTSLSSQAPQTLSANCDGQQTDDPCFTDFADLGAK